MLLQVGILVFGLGVLFLLYSITSESADFVTGNTMVEGKEFKKISYGIALAVFGALIMMLSALMEMSW